LTIRREAGGREGGRGSHGIGVEASPSPGRIDPRTRPVLPEMDWITSHSSWGSPPSSVPRTCQVPTREETAGSSTSER
jgi:hypothetical protein